MKSFIFQVLLVLIFTKDSDQCQCPDGGDRIIQYQKIPNNLCSAKTLIKTEVKAVDDGPDGFLKYKIKVLEVLRGDKDIQQYEYLHTVLPEPLCEPDVYLVVGEVYILSVDKNDDYLTQNLCQYGSEIREVTELQRKIIKEGCSSKKRSDLTFKPFL